MDNDTEMQLVWLLPDIRRKTAHVYYDYIKSPSGQPFLSGRSSCGANRDERLRIPADELGDRKCKSCLRNVERNARRDRERAEALAKYGVKDDV